MDSLRKALRINSPKLEAKLRKATHSKDTSTVTVADGDGISGLYEKEDRSTTGDSPFFMTGNGGGSLQVGSVASTTGSSMNTGGSGDIDASAAMSASTSSVSSSTSSPSPPPSPTAAAASVQSVTYLIKYLGSTLVDSTNGQDVCTRAVKRIITMSRQSAFNSKVGPVSLTVSADGVRISPATARASKQAERNRNSCETGCDNVDDSNMFIDIYRVAHCTVDDKNSKIFALIARNSTNDTLECFAFHCGKRQTAEAVCLTLAHAFQSVYEQERNELSFQQVRNQFNRQPNSSGIASSAPTHAEEKAGITGSRISLPVSTDCPYSTVSIHSTSNAYNNQQSTNGEYLMDFSLSDESEDKRNNMILVKEFCGGISGEDEFDELARARGIGKISCRDQFSSPYINGGSAVSSMSMSASSSMSTGSSHTSSPMASHHSIFERDAPGISCGGGATASTMPIPIPMRHMEVRFNKLQLRT